MLEWRKIDVRHTTNKIVLKRLTAVHKLHRLKTSTISRHRESFQNSNMSLYHEAAQILTTVTQQSGSIKSIVFGKKEWKTDRKTLFALSTEAAKWSEVLSEVVEKSDLLDAEKQVSTVIQTHIEIFADTFSAYTSIVTRLDIRSAALQKRLGPAC